MSGKPYYPQESLFNGTVFTSTDYARQTFGSDQLEDVFAEPAHEAYELTQHIGNYLLKQLSEGDLNTVTLQMFRENMESLQNTSRVYGENRNTQAAALGMSAVNYALTLYELDFPADEAFNDN